MARWRRIVAGGAGLIWVAATPAQARPGDASCVFGHLPGPVQGLVLEGASDQMMGAAPREMERQTSDAILLALDACGVSLPDTPQGDRAADAVSQALTQYSVEILLSELAIRHGGVRADALERAWKGLGAAEQERLGQDGRGGLAAVGEILNRAVAITGWTPPPGLKAEEQSAINRALRGYFLSRALRTESEKRF